MIPEEAELFDFWESDGSDDLVFSQVDISALCNGAIQETQVFTNTQTLGGEETVCNIFDSTLDTKENKASLEGSVVTEVWDFVEELGDSDSEDFLQTALEEFEKSQSVSAVKNKTPHKDTYTHMYLKLDSRHRTVLKEFHKSKQILCDGRKYV